MVGQCGGWYQSERNCGGEGGTTEACIAMSGSLRLHDPERV